ncbi:lipopolysaccharide biosynthesis protein [Halostella sp. JP-L12]|uniref:lipopolysaccharide biosynthesis protein n=1 Tax=Halostella TaxID=1843185 RepID=UPI000EF7C66F|nr:MULTISPECIES: lipopolysaccharide biosynthesis protein [Halostella]NHN48721.1 lipopolysaccharide biosynthesis protein [Halostella sp. JP-L12]
MRLGRTTLIHFASQVGVSLAGFIATFAIARLLGASSLGTYAIAVALLFWLNVPASAVGNAINKRVSEGIDRGSYLTAGFVLNAAIAAVVAVAIVIFAGQVDAYVGASVSDLVAALVIGNVALITVVGALNGQKKVAQTGVLRAIERVGRTGFQVALILLSYGLTGLLVGHAASLAVAALLGVVLFEVRPSMPAREHLRSLLKYARYSWLGTLKTRAFGWMDTIVLAFFVPSALIGIYEVTWTLASTLALVSNSIQKTLFPELSELSVEENYDRVHHFLNEGLVFTGIFAIPGLFGAAVIGPRILKIYRPEFTRGASILLVLIVARTLAAFGTQFLSAINAIDRPDVAFRINLVFVVSNVVLNVVLISQFGWYGAAAATALSATITLTLGYLALVSLIGRPEIPYREIAREFSASLVMAGTVYAMAGMLPGSHYTTLALVLVGGAVYAGVLVGLSNRVRQKAVALLPEDVTAR